MIKAVELSTIIYQCFAIAVRHMCFFCMPVLPCQKTLWSATTHMRTHMQGIAPSLSSQKAEKTTQKYRYSYIWKPGIPWYNCEKCNFMACHGSHMITWFILINHIQLYITSSTIHIWAIRFSNPHRPMRWCPWTTHCLRRHFASIAQRTRREMETQPLFVVNHRSTWAIWGHSWYLPVVFFSDIHSLKSDVVAAKDKQSE